MTWNEKEWQKEYNKKYREINKEKIIEQRKKSYEENKEIILERNRKWREANKDLIRERKKEYRAANRDIINKHRKHKYDNDPAYKMIFLLRGRMCELFNRYRKRKSRKTSDLLGCSSLLASLIIEAQCNAYSGMGWNNHGVWHIDHVRPLCSFDLTDEKQLLEACHISNLQPLWAKDNLSKGSKHETYTRRY